MPQEKNKSESTPITDLLRALELAHYAERFRNSLFVIALKDFSALQELLQDVKVLAGYHIKLILLLPDPKRELKTLIDHLNKRGTRFSEIQLTSSAIPEQPAQKLVLQALESGLTPVIGLEQDDSGFPGLAPQWIAAGNWALALGADKLILVDGGFSGLIEQSSRSHIFGNEIDQLLANQPEPDRSGFSSLMTFLTDMLSNGIPDCILLEGQSTCLYQEVFTHDGAGLLFNNVKRSLIRPAREQDITDIALLLRPEVTSGRILSVDENLIEARLNNYLVYEIDGLLVGQACLKPFGEWAELSQFATLPRYRGKGRARELALRLVEEAASRGFNRVFALSIDERMWEFFRSLSFEDFPRENLPQEWLKGYDLNRPSRAFVRNLK